MVRGDAMNGFELTTAINTLAVILAEMFDEKDLALLAATLVQMGDTLDTIAVTKGNGG